MSRRGSRPSPEGTAYLIHLWRHIGHGVRGEAGHYLGSSDDLPGRLEAHRAGNGARLMEVAAERGIGWTLARTWPGGGAKERQLKRRHDSPQMCPECGIRPRKVEGGSVTAAGNTSAETKEIDLISGSDPRTVAELLRVLEEGSLAGWHYASEAAYRDPQEHKNRLDYAADVDTVYRDALWQNIQAGVRKPGETVAEFGERIEREDAEVRASRDAGVATADQVIRGWADAGMSPDQMQQQAEDEAARLLSDAETGTGRAFAQAWGEAAGTYISDLREDGQLPVPVAATLPDGTPHTDPQRAAEGWQAQGGIYVKGAAAARAGVVPIGQPVATDGPDAQMEAAR